jgi:hypothetical protein
MYEHKQTQKTQFDLTDAWSYGVLILTLALPIFAQMAMPSPLTITAPASNGAYRLIRVERDTTEGSLSAPSPTAENKTPALPVSKPGAL